VFKDTRLLSGAERAVFAGVVETRHGTHYRFHNQLEALKELAKRLGFYAAADSSASFLRTRVSTSILD
jgi:hypothetical protein